MVHPRCAVSRIALTLLAAGLAWGSVFPMAQAVAIPPNDGFVTDAAGLLTPEQKQAIEADLGAYRQATSNEIAIVTLPGLEGQPIEDVGLEIGRKWGVGSKAKNNGILIVIAKEERYARIDVGYGLEGAVPDIVAKGIIERDMVPRFRDGDYGGGITAAIDALKKHIGGEYTADRYTQSAGGFDVGAFFIFLLFAAFQGLLAFMARSRSWWLGGVVGSIGGVVLALLFGWWLSIPALVALGLLLDFFVSRRGPSRRGRGGWWIGGGGLGGGGRGGGFGGFSGGSFGGGGASGRW